MELERENDMTYSFLESFAPAAYPCYWLAPDGEFWMNEAAQEVDNPLYDGDMVRRLLVAQAEASGIAGAADHLLGGATRLWGLSVLPLEGGLLAVMTDAAATPTAAIGARLRDPITNIMSSLSPLAAQAHSAAAESHLEDIQRNCYILLRLAVNLENAATGKREPKGLPHIDLADHLRALFASVGEVIRSREIPIDLDLPETPLPVRANARLLSEAIFNILRNSLQYTRDGNRIRVRLRTAGRRALLTIEDEGLGIQPENLGRVFEPYFSAEPYGDSPETPGLGLGLAVAQEVARAHGGTLTCESRFGEGTRVSLALPLDEGGTLLESEARAYHTSKFSPLFVQLEGFCLPPAVESAGL